VPFTPHSHIGLARAKLRDDHYRSDEPIISLTRERKRHGLDGLSKLPEAPHLAGQPEQYLVKSLNEYRSGARKNDMMSLVAPALSDQDVADLAAYYAAIEISATPPK
jgi:cytochrome c553